MATQQTSLTRSDLESDPAGRRRPGLVAPLATAAAIATGAAVIRWRDPSVAGSYPRCPFQALTGLDCPGCGSLRGTHALLHGDLLSAVSHNLLLMPGALLALWLWVVWVTDASTGRRLPTLRATPVVTSVLVGTVLVFTVARNFPGLPFLAA